MWMHLLIQRVMMLQLHQRHFLQQPLLQPVPWYFGTTCMDSSLVHCLFTHQHSMEFTKTKYGLNLVTRVLDGRRLVLYCPVKDFQVIFHAVMGVSNRGDIAIDDVIFSPACKFNGKVLPGKLKQNIK